MRGREKRLDFLRGALVTDIPDSPCHTKQQLSYSRRNGVESSAALVPQQHRPAAGLENTDELAARLRDRTNVPPGRR